MGKTAQAGTELQKALGISDSESNVLGLLGMARLLVARYNKALSANELLRHDNEDLRRQIQERVVDEW